MINFKEERERQGYSIEDISNILRIRKQYIIAIEEDRLGEIPSETYAKGYVKTYCEFLKIPIPEKRQEEQPSEKLPSMELKNSKYYIAAISLLLPYLPMQKLLNISPKISSTVILPVMLLIALAVMRKSSVANTKSSFTENRDKFSTALSN